MPLLVDLIDFGEADFFGDSGDLLVELFTILDKFRSIFTDYEPIPCNELVYLYSLLFLPLKMDISFEALFPSFLFLDSSNFNRGLTGVVYSIRELARFCG